MDLLAATFYLHLDFKILFSDGVGYVFFVQTIKQHFSGALVKIFPISWSSKEWKLILAFLNYLLYSPKYNIEYK